ncbi:ROK family transcriptional regulator [Treponema sp.]
MSRRALAEKTEKTRNAARIIRTIWKNPLISRIEIAEHLNLERSTITHQVSRLLELGLVNEMSEGQAGPNGGRKPIHLSINKDYGYIIGIEMQMEAYSVIAVSLSGEILGFQKIPHVFSAAHLVDDLLRITEDFAAKQKSKNQLLGVGVGMSGIIDSEKGVIHFSIPLDLNEPFDFSAAMAEGSKHPFMIGNDANCCSWGELAFHKANGLKNSLFVLIQFLETDKARHKYGGVGVGLGIVIDGKVYSGNDFTAGEFRSAFWTEGNRTQFSIPEADIVNVVNDPSLMERFVRELSKNLAVLINTFDLNQVFVGGTIENFDVDFPRILKEEIKKNWMYPDPDHCEVSYSSLGERAVAYGAAGMLLHRIFASTHLAFDVDDEQDPLVRALHL